MIKVLQEHNKSLGDDNASETLRLLAIGPKLNVLTWKGCDMKKISFYTKSQANKSRVQNSRVSLDVDSLHFSSASDNNLIHVSMPFFRVIEET